MRAARCHKGTGDAGIQKDGEGQASVVPARHVAGPLLCPLQLLPGGQVGQRDGERDMDSAVVAMELQAGFAHLC